MPTYFLFIKKALKSETSLCHYHSRQLVYINMVVFIEEDRILITNLTQND